MREKKCTKLTTQPFSVFVYLGKSLSSCEPVCKIAIIIITTITTDFPVAQQVKNLPADAKDTGDAGLIPGLGCSPGGGHGNPPHYSCLENSMDRGAWRDTVRGSAKKSDMK